MSNLNFKGTISLAATIYKRAFKITFALAFMLSFISEFCFVYLMNHGMDKFIQSNGEADVSQLPSGNILAAMFLIIMVATIFVYAMIIILQGIMIKHELKVSDALKIALQIFSKRVFAFLRAFLLSMIAMTLLTMFLQYIGIFLAILLFLTVMPAVLLAQKGVFESLSANFYAVKNNFFYMFRISITILAFMIIKPLLTFGLIYLLKDLGVEIGSLEMSIQNIVVTVVDAFILPFIFAISVAAFFSTSSK
ncbi:hypothetical protein [Francisella tularensis]|uniref:hypothetical protein n=1 Tax=Francisella tularensis TaxID=263 RepID=UPI000173E3D3|nr:hypothetical protein [Francisella tularensis]ACD31051.1 hypothetical membrane protein [Francisella tularensis subsp. mediasiatica FSC147]MBK2078648.1 hypothetical protein [Francisella tularensis subsp. mediasiatica]MBK2101140.1 hypothetical protein [Francisella tularensis subsp. mediasiatica]MBK2104776.1 hypothetical protein [Francisella tularensis subsp. mediasiatica]MDN9003966.1 hypothetical protein [Francisella tularensis subsp. mediasiatica]